MIETIQLLCAFLGWLIIGSAFCLGFYIVTRDGEIGGAWERHFDAHVIYRPQIRGTELLDKYIALESLEPDIYNLLAFDSMQHSLKKIGAVSDIQKRKIEIVLGVEVQSNRDYIFLRGIERVYNMPWKIRKMAGCPICMSGWIGTALFIVAFRIFGFSSLFAHLPIGAIPLGWIGYCVSLAFVNKAIGAKFEV